MGEIPIKKVAPNLDPRGVDESTRIFYAEEFKRSSKEHTCAVSSNQQIMGQQEMTESINLEDIPRDCLPIALLQSETAAFEQFMMKPNVQDAQIWTVLGNFMHRSVAEAVNTVGSVSTSELEEHSKLKFLIWFFKEIQTIKESIEIAIVCSNKTTEKILVNAVKGRGFKTTRLQFRGFSKDAYGFVFCHNQKQVKQKDRDIQNNGYTIDLVLLVEVPIDINPCLPRIFSERPVRIVQLVCVGSPEIRLYNVQNLLRKHSRALLPHTALKDLPPLVHKQVFTRKNLHNSSKIVSQWNAVVRETLLRWFLEGREKHYRFHAFDQHRRLLEYLESASSRENPPSHMSSPRLSNSYTDLLQTSTKRIYDYMSSTSQERDTKKPRAPSSPPHDPKLSQQRPADPRQSTMNRDPRIRQQQQQQEQVQNQREIQQQAEQLRQSQREQQLREMEQQIQHQRQIHQQMQQLLELQREKRLQELELQQYRAQQKNIHEEAESVVDLRVNQPSSTEHMISNESMNQSCTHPSNPVQNMQSTEADSEQIEEDPEPIVPERVRANLLGEETDYEEIVKNAIRQFELNLQRI